MEDEIFHEILDSIKDALKELRTDQKEIKKDISLIKEDVAVHISRTNILQDEVRNSKDKNDEKFKEIIDEFKPIWKHINYAKGGIALIGILSSVVFMLSLFHKI